ncbi:MAG TPA: dTMP kinase, partial [Candidatus Polarisedimenticolia bacterium]|nr:dTMP kinase [Candidatus Polarisedimenticolia bacterium]
RARSRDHTKSKDETRFEQEDLAFHERVRAGYLDLAHEEPDRVVVIDARGDLPEVHLRVLAATQRFLTTSGAPE